MSWLPPEAPPDVRQVILAALKNHDDDEPHYTIYDDGQRFLLAQNFDPNEVVGHLVDYLEDGYRLYLLQGPTIKGIKYQCCLAYEDDLDIHVKITPRGDGGASLHIMLGFHRHNTGYARLPY